MHKAWGMLGWAIPLRTVLSMKLPGILVLLLWLVGLTGCRSPAMPSLHGSYPLGIYAVKTAADCAAVSAAGFNLVAGPADRAFLDAARSRGLEVLAPPGTSAGPGFDPIRSRQTIR